MIRNSVIVLGLLFSTALISLSTDTSTTPIDNQLTFKIQVYETTTDGQQLIAEPVLVTNWNKDAQVSLGDSQGSMLSIEIKTKK